MALTKLEAIVMQALCLVMGWAFILLHSPILALCFLFPGAVFGIVAFRKSNHD